MAIVKLSANTPADLYSLSGIAVGTQLTVSNVTSSYTRLADSEQGLTDDYQVIRPYAQAYNGLNATGAWAESCIDSALNVAAKL